MKRRTFISLMSVMAAAGVLSLAGCSSNTSASTASSTAASASAAAANKLETIQSNGKLVIALEGAWQPWSFHDESDTLVGYDVEVSRAIAEKLGLELDILDMDFDSALLAVQQGKSDIVMAGVTVNEDRLLVMDFTDSYATGVQVVIVKEGSDVTMDNMGEGLIGTQRGTTGNLYCTDDYGEEHVVAYDDGFTAVQALMNGQVDCVVIDNAPAQEFVKNNAGLTILDTEYAVEDYAIGLNKGNTALLDAINGALAELISDGTVQTIIDKYIPAE